MDPYNLTILDTSSLFQYSPSSDGPIPSSWNATFSDSPDSSWLPQSNGVGVSSHRTTLAGATVGLNWTGTAVYLYGNASTGGYVIHLDGNQINASADASGLLFASSGLDYKSHILELEVVQGETSINNATITLGMGITGSTVKNYTIDTTTLPITNRSISLTGTWFNGTTYGVNNLIVPRIGTNTSGSSLSFPLTSAVAFYIVGHVNFDHAPYHVVVASDSLTPEASYYNTTSRWISLYTIQHLSTGLDRTRMYQVQVISDGDGLWYEQSQIVVFDAVPPPQKSTHARHLKATAIAGIVIGSILGLLLLLAVCFFCLNRRRRPTSYVSHRRSTSRSVQST